MEALVTKFEAYLLTEKCVAVNTHAAYKRDIAQYTGYLLNHKLTLQTATLDHMRLFLKHLTDNAIVARSLARKISALKTFYAYLHDYHGIENHAKHIAMPKLERKLPQYLTEQEVERLLATTDHDKSITGIRNKVMIYLLYGSGMRISELVTIKKSAIHFDTGFVTVAGKGGKDRMVPLPQDMLSILRMYLDEVYARLLFKEGRQHSAEYLFPVFYSKKIKPISRQAFWIILKRIAQETQLTHLVSPHTLRHSLATHLLRKGADLRSLQLLLGHEQLSTIQIYTHLDTEQVRSVYNKKHPRS
jgi:integrase/recombinase XerD